VAVQRLDDETATEGRHMKLWHMGNMDTGEMQYWSQTEATNTFESWFQDNNRTIPAHHDRNDAGMQHNTTSSTSSCNFAPTKPNKHALLMQPLNRMQQLAP